MLVLVNLILIINIIVLYTKFTGFIGDRIGYKPVLLVSIIAIALCGTCFDFIPRYKEYYRYPSAMITLNTTNNNSFILKSVNWPITYPECDVRDTHNITLCENSPPLTNETFYDDIKTYLRCKDENGVLYQIESLDVTEFRNLSNNNPNITYVSGNGTFCVIESNNATLKDIYCDVDITNNPYVGKCRNTKGSHAAMFWTYLFLRTLWQIFQSACFALCDGSSMCLVKEHKSSYAMILIWQSIAVILGPLIGGPLVHDSEDKGGNYCTFKRQYYINVRNNNYFNIYIIKDVILIAQSIMYNWMSNFICSRNKLSKFVLLI